MPKNTCICIPMKICEIRNILMYELTRKLTRKSVYINTRVNYYYYYYYYYYYLGKVLLTFRLFKEVEPLGGATISQV